MLQVFLAGNLGKPAELRDAAGTPVASFSVAVTQRVKREKRTTWVNCSIFGARANALVQYLQKGTRVAVSGELTTRDYNGKTYLECRVSEVTMLGGGERGEPTEPKAGPASSGGGFSDADYGNKPIDDDLIPFITNVTTQPAELWWSR